MVSFGFDESTTLQARNPNPSPSPGSSMLQPWLQPETRWRRGTSRRSRGRSSGGPARTWRSALDGSDAFGHPGRSVGCPRIPRRTRPDPHARPLLCGRRRRQLFFSRGAPAAEGVEARGGRGGVGTCCTGSGWSRRSDGKAGRLPRQVASAGTGAVLKPADRPVLARAGGFAGAGSCRHRRPRGRRHLPRRHQLSALLVARGRSVRPPPLASPAPLPEV